MTKMHRSETAQDTALKQAALLLGMIDDLQRTVQILNVDICTEEECVRVFDRCDPAYSIPARTLTNRRDNLNVTIAALTKRLEAVSMAIPTAQAA